MQVSFSVTTIPFDSFIKVDFKVGVTSTFQDKNVIYFNTFFSLAQTGLFAFSLSAPKTKDCLKFIAAVASAIYFELLFWNVAHV